MLGCVPKAVEGVSGLWHTREISRYVKKPSELCTKIWKQFFGRGRLSY